MGSDRIELLSEDLIDQFPDFTLDVLAASSRLGLALGWHYLLDIVWILSEIQPILGGTILDAGAGTGLTQYLLADRGCRVVSADMTVRSPREDLMRLYSFKQMGGAEQLEHEYLAHHNLAQTPGNGQNARSIRGVFSHLKSLVAQLSGNQRTRPKTPEVTPPPPGDLPTIILYRCNIAAMTQLPDSSVDAAVSVSALEHNPPALATDCMLELERVVRPGGVICITVSACRSGTSFHEPSHSWILDERSLRQTYRLRDPTSNFGEFDRIFGSLERSRYLRKWLSAAYFADEKNGMPWGNWNPQYQPVGIRKQLVGY